MNKVEESPSPRSLAKETLVRRLVHYFGVYSSGNVSPKACACIGASDCDDLACPLVWEYWLKDDRLHKLIHLAVIARDLHQP